MSNYLSNPYLVPAKEIDPSSHALVSALLEAELLPDLPTFLYLCLMCRSLSLLTFWVLYGSQRTQASVVMAN